MFTFHSTTNSLCNIVHYLSHKSKSAFLQKLVFHHYYSVVVVVPLPLTVGQLIFVLLFSHIVMFEQGRGTFFLQRDQKMNRLISY